MSIGSRDDGWGTSWRSRREGSEGRQPHRLWDKKWQADAARHEDYRRGPPELRSSREKKQRRSDQNAAPHDGDETHRSRSHRSRERHRRRGSGGGDDCEREQHTIPPPDTSAAQKKTPQWENLEPGQLIRRFWKVDEDDDAAEEGWNDDGHGAKFSDDDSVGPYVSEAKDEEDIYDPEAPPPEDEPEPNNDSKFAYAGEEHLPQKGQETCNDMPRSTEPGPEDAEFYAKLNVRELKQKLNDAGVSNLVGVREKGDLIELLIDALRRRANSTKSADGRVAEGRPASAADNSRSAKPGATHPPKDARTVPPPPATVPTQHHALGHDGYSQKPSKRGGHGLVPEPPRPTGHHQGDAARHEDYRRGPPESRRSREKKHRRSSHNAPPHDGDEAHRSRSHRSRDRRRRRRSGGREDREREQHTMPPADAAGQKSRHSRRSPSRRRSVSRRRLGATHRPRVSPPVAPQPLGARGHSRSGKDDGLPVWLEGLDGGRGVMLQYLDAVRREFGDISHVSKALLENPVSSSVVGCLAPGLYEKLGIKALGHRLLLVKGVLALAGRSAG